VSPMHVLVTGGSGFLGTNLAEHLLGHGAEVLSIDTRPPRLNIHRQQWRDVDILDRTRVAAAVRDFEPTLLFHLAARTDLHGTSLDEYAANVQGLENVIAAVRKTPSLKRVVFASSRMVCRIDHRPKRDDEYSPPNAYGESKVAGERIVRDAGLEVPWLIVRPTSIWGPLFDVPYKTFFLAIAHGRYVHAPGQGVEKSFGYVGNTVHQLERLATAPESAVSGRTFYLGDYPPVNTRDLAERIRAEIGAPRIRTVPHGLLRAAAVAGDALRRLGWREPPLTSFRLSNLTAPMVFDLSPLEEVVGPLPHSLDAGIRSTVEWLRKAGELPPRRRRPRARQNPVVHVATSSGGHINLLVAVRSAFDGYRRIWVVQPSPRADVLRDQGEEVHVLPEYDRHLLRANMPANVRQALGLVITERPRVVVTSGAGITVPFCVLARIAGAKIIFVETTARVTGPSASGKALSRLASRAIVQWPEVAGSYPRSRLSRPALLDAIRQTVPPPGVGTFVGVGTHSQPFDRLLKMVDRAVGDGVLPKPVVAQGGPSRYRPQHYELQAVLPPDEVDEAVQNARHVVCHAGSGLITSALRAGRKPLVLARLARHGEHFDDHQLQLLARLEGLDLVVGLKGAITPEHVGLSLSEVVAPETDGTPSVERALSEELERLTGGRATSEVGRTGGR
jgi:GlcNAc-P-P-Und epimerase